MNVLLEHLRFLDENQDLSFAFVGIYNPLLVALSVIVTCLAAYSALRIVGRIHAATTRTGKTLWLAMGAITMGIGVWAMHFVGMLAFVLPVPVSYDLILTLLSMVPAILASAVMLYVISRERMGIPHLLLGGILMGAGIGLMHYTGMAAMHMNAVMLYKLPVFMASLVVAVVLATVALYTKFLVSTHAQSGRHWTQVSAALIMGLAVTGMHYTGMVAVAFFPPGSTPYDVHAHDAAAIGIALDPIWLAAWVLLISVVIIGITTFVTMLDHRLEISRRYGEQLEVLVAGRTEELQKANERLQEELDERRKTQEALRLAKEAAEIAAQAKAEFLANMSHEIRTPLNAIVGMAELLMDTPLVDEQRDFTDTIRTSSDSLLSVINDILDFSKIEAQKMDFENQPYDLHKCVEEALDMIAIKASAKNLELAFWAEPDVPLTVIGDITRLRQILLNLLNNAIKFTESGEVVVSVSSKPLPTVPAAHQQNDSTTDGLGWCELHFTVRDTGIGIPLDRMDRLFQPFSQLDASTTRKYGGTGLGLIICQRLSELMGGRMWVESNGVGQGSTFHFTIQAQIVNDNLALDQESVELLPAGKRGLVVDDNNINLRIITRQLEAWGVKSRAAVSGEEALSWVQAGEHYDFAILDLCMPEMDGFTLAKRLHELLPEQELPLVMLSSLGDKNVYAEAERLRFAAVLAKPVKQTQLGRVLRNILGQGAPTAKPTAAISGFDPDLGQRMPLRILLAEDNAVNQKVAQLMLARLGYQVKITNNGLEAVQELQRQPYDVVLMDVQMPEMDGLEATRQIVATWPADQRPYIIAMTAHALTGDAEKCIAAGMNAYVSKPIQVDRLVAALTESRNVLAQ